MDSLQFNPFKLFLLLAWVYGSLWCLRYVLRRQVLSEGLRIPATFLGLFAGPILLIAVRSKGSRPLPAPTAPRSRKGLQQLFADLVRRFRPAQEVESTGPDLDLLDEAGRELADIHGQSNKQAARIYAMAREIIADALSRRASDLLVDPMSETAFNVRLRIDGVLSTVRELDGETGRALINSIKAVSGMDISERRRPQDGAFSARQHGVTTAFRIATAGVIHGEKLSIRVLNRAAATFALKDAGLTAKQCTAIERALRRPAGMILLCGPTGSGKTTTMYAMLNAMDRTTHNVITVEDPVEAILPDASQISVNRKADITFGQALRNILRHDPDVISVGEIRDEETAEIALRAAQTGHLVLATVHADSTAMALIRLLDLGISPLLLTSGLAMVISQRLLRKLCPRCKAPDELAPELLRELEAGKITGRDIFRAVGCEHCNRTGYYGRVAVADLMELTEETKAQLSNNPALIARLRLEDDQKGKTSLRREGLKRVAVGITTIEEVDRVIGGAS